MRIEISAPVDASAVDEVRPLWEALRAHHSATAAYRQLNADAEQAWDLRRQWYLRTVRDGGVVVTARGEGEVVGYAVVSNEPGADDTFDVGSGVAEIISLVVTPGQRGHGVGASLMSAVEEWATSHAPTHAELWGNR